MLFSVLPQILRPNGKKDALDFVGLQGVNPAMAIDIFFLQLPYNYSYISIDYAWHQCLANTRDIIDMGCHKNFIKQIILLW